MAALVVSVWAEMAIILNNSGDILDLNKPTICHTGLNFWHKNINFTFWQGKFESFSDKVIAIMIKY